MRVDPVGDQDGPCEGFVLVTLFEKRQDREDGGLVAIGLKPRDVPCKGLDLAVEGKPFDPLFFLPRLKHRLVTGRKVLEKIKTRRFS